VAPISRQLPRMDLRNHRKLAVIDGKIAYAGSHNMINADYGRTRCGPWVDLTARYTGPVVAELAAVFNEDWAFETGEELPALTLDETLPMDRGVPAQVVPTGPSPPGDTFRRVLLAAVECALERLILTTPYFVPDEPTLVALQMAADRGVDVTLIVPQQPDHPFTAAAGRAQYSRLMQAGVSIWQFQPGLIHAKTTTVDNALAVVGSANLDVRSFNLNFELSVLLYGADVTNRVREIQLKYLAESRRIDPDVWSKRPLVKQYAERAVALLSPLL
jgi:cardiolipin synthase